jgi:hypothetical protein
MAWTEVIKGELYKNENGCFLKKENGTYVLFDQDVQTVKIPIIDILENPVYKYTTAWTELKTITDRLNADLNNLAQNTSALFLSIIANEDLPAFIPVTLNGKRADSSLLSQVDATCQGISSFEVLTNNAGLFQASGVIINPLWNWTVNQSVFMNGNTLSQIRPSTGFLQRVGIAKRSDTLILKISDPIRL